MILFSKLRYKNFLSTGNQFTEIQLDRASTTLILGTNGSGKSTILDAICFGMFGKPFRKIRKDQMINTINGGDTVVEVEWSIGTRQYKVVRGIKPNIFELYEDGQLVNQDAAAKDYQKHLEDDILKVSYDSFTQVVILGNASYTPFMQLKAAARREFIEHVLDIGVFSLMNDVLKERIVEVKDDLNRNANDEIVAQEQLGLIEGFITKLEDEAKRATADAERQIGEQEVIIADLTPSIASLSAEIDAVNERIDAVTTSLEATLTKKVKAVEKAAADEISAIQDKRRNDIAEYEKTSKQNRNAIDTALQAAIEQIEETLANRLEDEEDNTLDLTAIQEKLAKFRDLRIGIVAKREAAEERIAFYENTTSCQACGQGIDPSHCEKIIAEKLDQIEKLDEGLMKLDGQINRNKEILANAVLTNKNIRDAKLDLAKQAKVQTNELSATAKSQRDALADELNAFVKGVTNDADWKVREITTKRDAEVSRLKAATQESIRAATTDDAQLVNLHEKARQSAEVSVSAAKQYLVKLRADLAKKPSGNIEEQKAKLGKINGKLHSLEAEKKEALELRQFYDAAALMLKDSGIKAAIIRQYLPSINALVNKYLAALDFFVSFTLDESFEETIKSRGRDALSYYSFSQGEKLRIDLALLFAWREIAGMKNSCSTNLLILDEVIDSSLDSAGTDLFIQMLNEQIMGANAFVISHKNDAALDKFKETLRFGREKNFSKLLAA